MSFSFRWNDLHSSAAFYESAKNTLYQALNSGKKLPLIEDNKIQVKHLSFGTVPPELDLLTIEELNVNDGSFKGRFMLSYNGDASISLATNVQVNPLTQYKHTLEILATPSVLLQTAQMAVHLTLSHLKLRAIIVLAFSKQRGLTLAFKEDPLESLNVSTSFDSISVLNQFIQTEIEHQLRERFRRDLPTLIHRLSQKWVTDIGGNNPHLMPSGSSEIVVQRESDLQVAEREPDDSFHDPESDEYRKLLEESRRANLDGAVGEERDRQYSVSPLDTTEQHGMLRPQRSNDSIGAVSPRPSGIYSSSDDDVSGSSDNGESESDLESASEYEVDDDRHGYRISTRSANSSLYSQSPRSPILLPHQGPSTPDRSSRSTTSSPHHQIAGVREGSGTANSPILRSLQRSNSSFATTFSVPTTAYQSGAPNDLAATLLESNIGQDGSSIRHSSSSKKATRRRLHRLDSASPSTSPVKRRHSKDKREKERMRIKRSELDEYFPVRTSSTGTDSLLNPQTQPVTMPLSSNKYSSGGRGGLGDFDRLGYKRGRGSSGIGSSSVTASASNGPPGSDLSTVPSLRRSMMNSRLRDSNYFTPSYPG